MDVGSDLRRQALKYDNITLCVDIWVVVLGAIDCEACVGCMLGIISFNEQIP